MSRIIRPSTATSIVWNFISFEISNPLNFPGSYSRKQLDVFVNIGL